MTVRVAVIHDWLCDWGGAERVLDAILAALPGADLYVLFDVTRAPERRDLSYNRLVTSPLQRLPGIGRLYRALLPVMPLAVEHWDLSGYDLVVSSSHSVAKGVIASPEATHLCYIHSPMRYAWDMKDAYPGGPLIKALRHLFLHRIRLWDQLSSQRVDTFIANSRFVAKRVLSYYRRPAEVIHPPVRTDLFVPAEAPTRRDFLTVSRLVSHKRVHILVEAFAHLPEQRLVVVGDGPELRRLKAQAPANVRFLGRRPTAEVVSLMQTARAFCSATIEDCGIAVLEAQACGTPVIAVDAGGFQETLGRPPTSTGRHAVLHSGRNARDFAGAIGEFLKTEAQFSATACRGNALRFAPEEFTRSLHQAIARAVADKHGRG